MSRVSGPAQSDRGADIEENTNSSVSRCMA
jgi:hypothetical protein